MSLIIGSAIAVGALYSFNKQNQKKLQKTIPAKKQGQIADSFQYSGTYGDTADVSSLLGHPGFVIDEKIGQDLSGMPCRWLSLRNGAVYRTYDMTTQYPH